MKPIAGRMLRAMVWPGVVWLSLLATSPLSAQQATKTLQGHTKRVTSVAYSPDGKTLASGSWDETIKLWDVATGKEQATLEGHTVYVTSVAFSPDGKTLASGSGSIKLWDVATGKEQATLRGHSNRPFWCVAFSPDGKTLASGTTESTIMLWDVMAGEQRAALSHMKDVFAVAFSPDGKTLATGDDGGTIKLWDVATRKEQATLMGHTRIVGSMAFSPDGKTLASGSSDKTIKLWDVATGKERDTLKGHTNVVSSVAFSPDGKTLASGSYDNTIKLWDVATEMVSVPNVIGLPVNEAAAKFQEKKLEYKENGRVITGKVPIGAIASQSPAADGRLLVGTKVMLTIEANSVEVPSLIGKTVGEALGNIRSLQLHDVIEPNSRGEIIMSDTVVRQSPEPGTRVAPGTKVTISQQ